MKSAIKYFSTIDNHKGFTLLEVMVSISIIALILTSIFRMQSSTTELATACKFDSIAPILAEQILIDIKKDIVSWSKTEGDFGNEFPGIKWNCKITGSSFPQLEFITQTNQNRLKKIELEIRDPSGRRVYKIITWSYIGE